MRTTKKEKKRIIWVAALLGLIALSFFLAGNVKIRLASKEQLSKEAPVVILDPGHGGVDGGAVGVNGSIEKDINLNIALALRDQLTLLGYDVFMTREDDRSIHDERIKGIANQKRSDLNNRLALMEEYPDAVVLMIHQNRFSQSKYSGAQVFYGKNHPESASLATSIQSAFVDLLQPDNTRVVKKGGKDIFLLYYSENPIAMVECGFLYNPEEEALLADASYQKKVALTIAKGLMEYENQGIQQQEGDQYGEESNDSVSVP